MFETSTLRGRLTLAYAAALISALVLFAVVTLVTLDSVQHRLLDAELSAVAAAEASAVDLSEAGTIDAPDRARFTSVAGRRVFSAVITSGGRALVASTLDIPRQIERAAAMTGTTSLTTLGDRGGHVRVAFVPIRNATSRVATIAVWSDIETIGTIDRNVGIIFVVALPLFAIFAALTGSAIARRGLAPLEQIIADASEIESHNLNARVTQPRTRELNRLATTVNRMLGRLSDAFERERRFSSDASHELRAPLSVILAEADLALATDRDVTEYRRALETIALEADALESLTRNLLASARVGSERVHSSQPVDLGEVATGVTERLRILAGNRDVTFRTDLPTGTQVMGDLDELERAVLTIVHNAIKYASLHGTIAITLASAGDTIELCVADDGPGFSEEALEHAFDRFWRGDPGEAARGHGLGLAIARSIVESSDGTITVANGAQGGALVTLRFHIAP